MEKVPLLGGGWGTLRVHVYESVGVCGGGVSPVGCINKPIQLNVAPALPNVPAPLQRCRRQQHPLLIRWSFASESWWRGEGRGGEGVVVGVCGGGDKLKR